MRPIGLRINRLYVTTKIDQRDSEAVGHGCGHAEPDDISDSSSTGDDLFIPLS